MKFKLFAASALLVLAANTVLAAPITTVCPIFSGGGAGGEFVDATYSADSTVQNGGCNVLITFNANGSITTTHPNAQGFYDTGGDDNMVGIVNNTGAAISSVNLSSATVDIFGFDGDGACDPTWTFSGTEPGGAAWPSNPCGGITSGYGHQGVTFSNIGAGNLSGTVNFSGGIAGGGSNWFTLEGPVALNLQINSPEPASFALFGLGLCGLGLLRRRQRKA